MSGHMVTIVTLDTVYILTHKKACRHTCTQTFGEYTNCVCVCGVCVGGSPYPGMQVGSAFYRMIQEGHRMNRPEVAPREIYDMMLSCWSEDPLKRPSFRKLVERTELLLSEGTKNVYLNLSYGAVLPDQQRAASHRLSSVSSTTAPTQPLLLNTADVFLDYDTV
uniref:Serine-threonine/tyrosine-protein kinase catalytic domain-containing protein n=1 Tax=Hucho hucho TaxID=62062 RepID=A0A4W5JWP6_9TELE